ncbi:polyprotein [Rodent hepatovirus CIV459Lopsik2004]|uniref:Genome polyprotein n=1 Tax=Rodent hepatovirus CIV459Lopsik2004 TaxID=1987141 RepID=A0A0S1M3C3_9PICO|nr:polyprotein [Rodent hepatovirus CIV459Lopsik2004]ALL35274.1 polyprotein [Rodent hepatovirus CIV459Lopsik2004]
MEHFGLLQTLGEGVDKILTLSDLEQEQVMQTPDRVSVAGASYFTSVDQSSVHSSVVGSHQDERLLTSVDMPASKKTQGERFFLIHTAEWTTTNANLNEIAKLDVVKLLYNQQFSVDGFLKYHTYARFGVEVQVQINPTSFQQGGLICALVPADQGYGSLTCLTCYPHGLLNCNINNVVRIKVPFVYTRGAYNLREPQYPIWELTIRVWSPLHIGTGTSTYVTVNVLARLTDLELHGLTPVSQMMRNEFRVSTTDNVMNLCNYEDARAKISLALDQESWRSDLSEAGGVKISNFSSWTSIPTLAAQFAFNASATVGQQIKIIPVDPYYYTIHTESPEQKCVTALASISQMFCFWRGDIVFDFQIFPTKYHSGRLLFCFYPGHENLDVSRVTLQQATSSPCAVMDITGIQSTLRFRVPWISDTPYRVNRYTKSAHVKGEYTAIGKLIVFCYNRLSHPSNVANFVSINVYMSAVNLECFAPIYHNMTYQAQAGDDSFSSTPEIEQNAPDEFGGITTPKDLKGKANSGKMDLAAGRVPAGTVTILEDPLLAKKTPQTFPERAPGVSRHTSDHMNIYKYMGRAHFLCTFTFTSNNKVYTFPLTLSATQDPPHGLPSTLRWFFSLFHLYRGPLDLSIAIDGATDVDGMIWFTPVGLASDTIWTEKASELSIDYKSSLGGVKFNTRRTGNVQLRLPWYTYLYAISANLDGTGDASDSTFGMLSIQISNYTSTDEYLSFSVYLSVTEESQFLFLRAPMNNGVLKESDGRMSVRARRALGDLESSVDDPRSDSDKKFEQEISNEIGPVEQIPSNTKLGQVYKDLRMDVGKLRMKYAQESLRKRKERETNFVSQSSFQDFLLLGKKTCPYRAFTFDGDIWVLNTPGYIQRKWGGNIKAFVKYNNSGDPGLDFLDWTVLPTDMKILQALSNLTQNRRLLDIEIMVKIFDYEKLDERFGECVSNAPWSFLGVELSTYFLNFFRCTNESKSVISKLMDASNSSEEFLSEFRSLSSEVNGFLDTVKSAVSGFVFELSEKKWMWILRTVLRMIRSGTFIWMANRIENGSKLYMGMLALELVDLGIDIVDAGMWFSVILKRQFEFKCDDKMMGLRSEASSLAEFLRNAVCGVSLFKSAKDAIIWLYDKVKDWYDENYGLKRQALVALMKHQEDLENVLSLVDDYCVTVVQESNKEQMCTTGLKILRCLRTFYSLTSGMDDLKSYMHPIQDAITKVHMKVRNIGHINQTVVSRPEPVVCYMYGERGGGKSLTSMALAVRICKLMKVDPKKNIYTKPVGSDYWDGYCGQMVCIMDDMGQNTDDEDWQNFCQLVSGCPLRLNMAALEEKGRHFVSPFIICTSNQSDPCPKTIYVKEAITRRLHFKVEVTPKNDYVCGNNMLDVEKAKMDGQIAEMSCVNIVSNCSRYTLLSLADEMVGCVQSRTKNMEEFMSLWSQAFYDGENVSIDAEIEELLRVPKASAVRIHLRKMFEAVKQNKWWLLGAALGVCGLAFGAWKSYKWFTSSTELESDGVYHGVTKPKNVVKLDQPVRPESQSIIEISNLVHKNLCRFGIGKKNGEQIWVLNCLGLKDDYVLIPSHAYQFDTNKEEFLFEREHVVYSISPGNVEVYSLDTGLQDVVIMRVPNMPKFRDITSHFIKRKDLDDVTNKMATLCTNYRGVYQMIAEGPVSIEKMGTYTHVDSEGNKHELTVNDIIRGKAHTLPGMCGGAVVSSNQKLQNPIIGIHVAGGHGNTMAKVVWQEMFEVINTKVLHSQRIRKVEFSQRKLNVGTKTLFHKSPIYDLVSKNLINYPASLPFSKQNDIDPIQVMLSKYDTKMVDEPDCWHSAIEAFKVDACAGFKQNKRLTIREAILGVGGMDGINMKSSPGIPYVFEHFRKEDLIEIDGDSCVLHPWLESRIKNNAIMMEKGGSLDVVYATSPKDELRPLEKVCCGKTRAIEVCPVDFTILCRVMWGEAIVYFQSNPSFTTGIAVGIDPDTDWDSLFRAMCLFGDKGMDLDFSGFDASLSPFMIWSAVRILGEMCGNAEIHDQSLFRSISNSVHQMCDLIFHVEGGMPSGTPCTSLLNSIVNCLCLYYVFSKALGVSCFDVKSVVKWITYGDDVLIVFNRDVDINFDSLCPEIMEQFSMLGLSATSSEKGVPRVVSLGELTFLKRKFHFEDDRFRPSINEKTIWSLVAWKRSDADFIQNLETASWFAFLKGFEYYSKFSEQLEAKLDIAKVEYKLKPYAYWLSRFKQLEFCRDMN